MPHAAYRKSYLPAFEALCALASAAPVPFYDQIQVRYVNAVKITSLDSAPGSEVGSSAGVTLRIAAGSR